MLGLFWLICLTDLAATGQLKLLFFAQPDPEHVAGFADKGQKKPNLFIDRLGRGRLLQPIGLILENGGFIDIDQ